MALASNGGIKTVYVVWSSHCDKGTYHGWVVGFDATSLAQVAVFNDSPNSVRSGIWQGGDGPAIDADGNVFVITGDGPFDVNSGGVDYGDSFIKLAPNSDRSLSVATYFTPSNAAMLSADDLDTGSGGRFCCPIRPPGRFI